MSSDQILAAGSKRVYRVVCAPDLELGELSSESPEACRLWSVEQPHERAKAGAVEDHGRSVQGQRRVLDLGLGIFMRMARVIQASQCLASMHRFSDLFHLIFSHLAGSIMNKSKALPCDTAVLDFSLSRRSACHTRPSSQSNSPMLRKGSLYTSGTTHCLTSN